MSVGGRRTTWHLGGGTDLTEEVREALLVPKVCGLCGTAWELSQPLPREVRYDPLVIEVPDGPSLFTDLQTIGCDIRADAVTIHRCRYGQPVVPLDDVTAAPPPR
jgi:hypothetical protein